MAASMKRKREQCDTQEVERKTKKFRGSPQKDAFEIKKTQTSSFSEIDFKVCLKDASTVFTGFEMFLEAVKSWSDGDGNDIVRNFCSSSPDCEEILQVLSHGSLKVQELHLVFACLEKILLRIVDDLNSKYHSTGHTIIRKLLSSHLKVFYSTLKISNRSLHIKTSLKLLIAMVMLGGTAAKLVLNHIDLGQASILPLLTRRDAMDDEDVRTCAIHLVIAFLLTGDNDIIRRVTQTKGLMDAVFKGIQYDKVVTIQLLLSTVMEKVVLNTSISKTVKVFVFSWHTLKELGQLFNWQGPTKWKEGRAGKKSVDVTQESPEIDVDEEQELVTAVASRFLIEVCSSFKNGVIFVDKSFGFSGRNQNHLMTSFLSSLTSLFHRTEVQDLVVHVLASCLDQLRYFMPNLTHFLSPRETPKWQKSMEFLIKIYSGLPNEPIILKIKEKKSPWEIVQILLLYTQPPEQVLNTVLVGLKNKSIIVNYVTMDLVKLMSERSIRILKELQQSPVYSDDDKTELVAMFKASTLKRLPDFMTIFKCWEKALLLANDGTPDELQQLIESCSTTIQGVLVRILEIVCLYQDLNPALMVEYPLILAKILDGVMAQKNDGDGDAVQLTKVYLLKLLSGTDAKRLPWSKKNVNGCTLLYQILEMISQRSISPETSPDLMEATLKLICNLLEGTGQFELHSKELEIWLKLLQHFDNTVLSFVSNVMMTYIYNPYPYMDKVCDIMAEVNVMATESTNIITKPISIKDILSVNIGDLDETEFDKKTTTNNKRFPFCPLMVVAMDLLQKSKDLPNEVKTYMSAAVLNSFHLQLDPIPFCKMMQSYDSCLLQDSCHEYVLMWLPGPKRAAGALKDSIPTVCLYSKILSADGMADILDSGSEMCIHQDLLHLTYILRNIKGEKFVVKHVKKLAKSLETYLSRLEDDQSQKEVPAVESMFMGANLMEIQIRSDSDNLQSSLRLVINHPLMQEYFLWDSQDSQCEKVSKVITDLVLYALKILNKNSLDVGQCLDHCQRRLLDALQRTKLGMTTGHNTVLEILKELVHCLDSDSSTSFLDHVLCVLDSNDLIHEDKNFGFVIEKLMKKLIGFNLRLVKLSKKNVVNLLTCFAGRRDMDPKILYTFFEKFQHLTILCSVEVIEKLLRNPQYHGMVILIMQSNAHMTEAVGQMICDGKVDQESMENVGIFITFLKLSAPCTNNDGGWRKVAAKTVKLFHDSLLELSDLEPMQQYQPGLVELFRVLIDLDVIGKKLLRKIETNLFLSFESTDCIRPHHICMLKLILEKRKDHQMFIQAVVKCFSKILGHNKVAVEDELVRVVSGISQEEVKAAISAWREFPDLWPHVIKQILKNLYTNHEAMKFVTSLVKSVYVDSVIDLTISIETIANMVMSHSSFLPVMFGGKNIKCKEVLLDMLLLLIELSPGSCHQDHLGVYLGAYGASLSLTDQKILKLLHLYEKNQMSFISYKPFLWGEKAVEHMTLKKSLGPSLKQLTMMQVLDIIDAKRMQESVRKFPLRRKLQVSDPQPADVFKSESTCYDPCFMLPFFSQLLAPDSIVDCKKFITTGCLGFVLSALSCHHEQLRTAAYHIIRRFALHLEMAKFAEREQLQYLIEFLQSSLSEPNYKMASIITQFFARSASLMLKPDEHMYMIINSFLLLKPSLDVHNIPEFFKLFNSSDLQYKVERAWILSLMEDGLRETADYRIFEKRYAFKLLQSFYDSSTSDFQTQIQVLHILISACKEKSIAKDLCLDHGFLVWVARAVSQLSPDKAQHVGCFCEIIHALWLTMIDKKANAKLRLSVQFCSQIFAVLKSLLWYLRDSSEDVLLLYFDSLLAVLKHISTMKFNKSLQTLTHNEVLLIVSYHGDREKQSNLSSQIVFNILQSGGYDTNILKQSSKNKKKIHFEDIEKVPHTVNTGPEVLGTPTDRSIENAADTENVMETDSNEIQPLAVGNNIIENEQMSALFNLLVQIISLWQSTCKVLASTAETAAVDVIVLQWLLGHVDKNVPINTICDIAKTIQEIIFAAREDSDFINEYFASAECPIYEQVLTSLLDMRVFVSKWRCSCSAVPPDLCQKAEQANRDLNRTLLKLIERRSDGVLEKSLVADM